MNEGVVQSIKQREHPEIHVAGDLEGECPDAW